MRQRVRVVPLFAVLAAACLGCGQGIHPVAGKVVWKDGAPATELKDGQVVFESTTEESTARGVIQSDGSFRLTTLKENDGALVGQHRVFLLEVRGELHPGSTDGILAPGKMDERFSDPSQSDLTGVVEPQKNEITLTVFLRQRPIFRRLAPCWITCD